MPQELTDFDAVRNLLDQLVADECIPGASLLVRDRGNEALFYATGLKDIEKEERVERDTIFRLFSMTKPIVAAAIMVLVDDGVLHLDDVVNEYFPEFANTKVYRGEDNGVETEPGKVAITVEQLLTHTAGFSYWFYPDHPVSKLYANDPGIGTDEDWRFDPALGSSDGLARTMSNLPLVDEPGNKWHYSMSLEVAGILIERLTGQRLGEFLKSKIFEPIGMSDTSFAVPANCADRLASLYGPAVGGGMTLLESGQDSRLLGPVPGHAGGGGLVSTIDDYSRFAEMLLQRGSFDGTRVLSEASAKAMMTNRLRSEQLEELPLLTSWGLGGTGDGLGFGLGGAVAIRPPSNGVPVFPGEYSWGGGASTTFWVDPANEMTVIFMAQLQPPSNEMLRDKLHCVIYDTMGLAPSRAVQ